MVKGISRKEGLTTLPDTAHLTKALELFGSGVHRIVIVKENTMDVVGVLTQLRLVQFFLGEQSQFRGNRSIISAVPQGSRNWLAYGRCDKVRSDTFMLEDVADQ